MLIPRLPQRAVVRQSHSLICYSLDRERAIVSRPVVTYPSIDDLSASFNRLRQAATELFRTSHVGSFVRGWTVFWVLGLMHAGLLHALPALGHPFARRPGHPGGILDPLAHHRLLVLVRHVAKVALRRGGCVAKSMGQTRIAHHRGYSSNRGGLTGIPKSSIVVLR